MEVYAVYAVYVYDMNARKLWIFPLYIMAIDVRRYLANLLSEPTQPPPRYSYSYIKTKTRHNSQLTTHKYESQHEDKLFRLEEQPESTGIHIDQAETTGRSLAAW